MTILQVYQTETDWLALVQTSVGRVTLKFDHSPLESEIATLVALLEAPVEAEWEFECEDGVVV